ncbi:cation/copper resistance transporter ATPase CopZ [Neokomagataea thailandica NBRC 106555]|uniref:Copper chaperone n=2 Tax=Neokomagataea TaxID=1223423 RepID=A0A4Y6V3M7_9PROT|nr:MULTISPECIES: heavy-metal-associated domain-containing protein [Neokomagataea]QDH24712.1 copper chaperone [Neokomagataea tanensis]GBR53771.1 cation/copper resistance transporter ATPase CopZ [Neokomagataea thailandica NBRC 106555]
MADVLFRVEGMSCEGCSKRLHTVLSAVAGVETVEVTLKPGEAKIRFDSAQVSEPALREAIEDSGFDVVN